MGLTPNTITAENATAIVQDSPQLAPALAAALTDWALARKMLSKNRENRAWSQLLQAADVVYPDPWRQRVRAVLDQEDLLDQDNGNRAQALKNLVFTADVRKTPPSTVVLLAGALMAEESYEEAVEFLYQSQQIHPADFWLNDSLAYCCLQTRPKRTEEAVAFFRVALGVRPKPAGHGTTWGSPCTTRERHRRPPPVIVGLSG